jgi:putative glutamine amidotransferase
VTRPLIGVSMDWTDDPRGRPFVVHELRSAYGDAIAAAGGAPVLLAPVDSEALQSIVERLDALCLTGGAFDVPPALYGEEPAPKLGKLKPERTAFEQGLLAAAQARQLPVLGICGGMQLMNVSLGGSLYQHLPDDLPGLLHEQPTDRRHPAHLVEVVPGSRLASLVGNGPLPVNTSHHQGVKRLATGLHAAARSEDGLVEAFEAGGARFFIGVEWHPELLGETEPRHRGLFKGLVDACGKA